MKIIVASGFALLLASAGAASAEVRYGALPPPPYANYGGQPPPTYNNCPPGSYSGPEGCICDETAVFYGPQGPGYNVHLRAPGVRVIGHPVYVPSGQVYVEGAPIYVEAPPITVASPQIYLARPTVYVKPGHVTVEPPTVHVAGCENGKECEAVGTSYKGN